MPITATYVPPTPVLGEVVVTLPFQEANLLFNWLSTQVPSSRYTISGSGSMAPVASDFYNVLKKVIQNG